MAGGSIKTVLYAASAAPLSDSRLYDAAYSAASDPRRQKTDRYRKARDRRLSLSAELLLRYGLRAAGQDAVTIDLDYNAQGKPFLKNSDVYFNVSHSEEYVICAVAGCEVGCDVEKISTVDLKIAKRFFFREEYDDIAAQTTPAERDELFCRYWTLKESFMKATGLGMKLPLDEFRIVLGQEISVIQSVDERSYSFKEFADIPGYRCALCMAGDCRDAELRIIDLAKAL